MDAHRGIIYDVKQLALWDCHSYDFPAWPWSWPWPWGHGIGSLTQAIAIAAATTTTSGSLIGFEMEKLDQVALDAAAKMLCKINKENIAPAGPKQNRGAWSEHELYSLPA